MRGLYGTGNLPAYIEADDPRPVVREKYKPNGNAAVDGFTRHARRAPYGAPGDFTSAEDADRYADMMDGMPSDS